MAWAASELLLTCLGPPDRMQLCLAVNARRYRRTGAGENRGKVAPGSSISPRPSGQGGHQPDFLFTHTYYGHRRTYPPEARTIEAARMRALKGFHDTRVDDIIKAAEVTKSPQARCDVAAMNHDSD